MTKEAIIEDICNIINNSDGVQHRPFHLAAERIFNKYVASLSEKEGVNPEQETSGVTVNVSDSYCKTCGGLLPFALWAGTSEPVRCKCDKKLPETQGTCMHWNIKSNISTVHKCPICEGRTVVPAGFYTPEGYNFSGTSCSPEICKACDGTGIIKT